MRQVQQLGGRHAAHGANPADWQMVSAPPMSYTLPGAWTTSSQTGYTLAGPGSTTRHMGARLWGSLDLNGYGHPSPLSPKSSRWQCIWIGVRGFYFMFLRQGFCHTYTPIDFEGASLGIRRSSLPRSADHGRLHNVSGQRWPKGRGGVGGTRMAVLTFTAARRCEWAIEGGLFVDTLWSDFYFSRGLRGGCFELHSALLRRGSDDFHAAVWLKAALVLDSGCSIAHWMRALTDCVVRTTEKYMWFSCSVAAGGCSSAVCTLPTYRAFDSAAGAGD